MTKKINPENDEVNLSELFAVIWANKLVIFMLVLIAIIISGYYSSNLEKKFTARAIFKIDYGDKGGFNVSKQLESLVSIAGSSSGKNKDTDALLERVEGRELILKVNESTSLHKDDYFNTYDPTPKKPSRLSNLKKFFIIQDLEAEKNITTETEQDAIIENLILKNYRKNVTFNETEAGAITVSVTHISPNKAADYANAFMEQIRQLINDENKTKQELRLSYLSETLADAIQEVETTQKNLTDFSLENSTQAKAMFMTGSLKLGDLRMEKRKAKEFNKLLSILVSLVETGNLDDDAYEALRSNHPLVDDVDFRRILGMSETVDDWTWPKIETIEAVNATLKERIKRLDVDIENIEENAKIFAASAEGLANIKRDAKIAEATYKIITQQVKTQALSAGFQPEIFQVFEYATVPLSPASPRIITLITLSALFTFIFGCVLVLINSLGRNVYYTQSALISDIGAKLSVKSNSIRRLSRKPIAKISSIVLKRRVVVADEIEVTLANQNLIYFLNKGGRLTSSGAARLLATQSSLSGRKVILCDITGESERDIADNSKESKGAFSVVKINDTMNILSDTKDVSFFTSANFTEILKDLLNNFDQVILCATNKDSTLGLMALKDFDPSVVLLAGLRSTKRSDIKKLTANQSVDILVYD